MLRKTIYCIFIWLVAMTALGAWAKEAKKAETISALEAMQMLTQEPKTTFLIDVRTRVEYTLLGHPPEAYNVPWQFATNQFQVKDGPYAGGKAPFTGYQLSPQPNPDFAGVVQSLFKPTDRLITICMDGDRGAEAADALVKAGFKKVYNVRHGLWGEPLTAKDQEKLAEKFSPHYGTRGKLDGWVFWGLPMTHEINPRYVYPPDLKHMQTPK